MTPKQQSPARAIPFYALVLVLIIGAYFLGKRDAATPETPTWETEAKAATQGSAEPFTKEQTAAAYKCLQTLRGLDSARGTTKTAADYNAEITAAAKKMEPELRLLPAESDLRSDIIATTALFSGAEAPDDAQHKRAHKQLLKVEAAFKQIAGQ